MSKIRVDLNLLDAKEVFSNLELNEEIPDTVVTAILDIKDVQKNFEYLVNSELIKKWEFDKETKELKFNFPEKVEKEFNINFRDINQILDISYSYYLTVKTIAAGEYNQGFIEEMKKNYKTEKRIISDELLHLMIKYVSENKSNSEDWFKRMKFAAGLDCDNFLTFISCAYSKIF